MEIPVPSGHQQSSGSLPKFQNVRVVKVQVGGNALIRAIAMICAVECLVAEKPAET